MAQISAVHHAHKRRRQQQLELERRKRLRLQRDRKQVERWFLEFDTSRTDQLNKEELAALFRSLEDEPSESVLEYIHANAKEPITRQNVIGIVTKFRAYVSEQRALDALFDSYDKNQSGQLEADQLFALMADYSTSCKPDQADLDFVLAECDADGSGTIGRQELLPALATWKQLLQAKHESKQSGFCLIT